MRKALAAEFFGTAFLLIAVVGSGIMGERLAGGNVAIALLANALATGAALYVLIQIFAPVSGAHFNPVVSFAFAIRGEVRGSRALVFALFQLLGALTGVALAHIMFGLAVIQTSGTERSGIGQWCAEIVATFGLLLSIFGALKAKPESVPAVVGLYIFAAYWFTSSTSFANPAVTIARTFTNTFAGIAPVNALPFIAAQLIGAMLAVAAARLLWASERPGK